MFSQAQMQAFQEASGILTEMVNAGQGWQIGTAHPYWLPWEPGQHLGLAFDVGQNEVTADKLAWLQKRGWIAQVFKDQIILAPLVFVDRRESCFHVTAAQNVSKILKNGLLTGALVGQSASKRKDCENYIYVSFDVESAYKWTEGHLLGQTNPRQEWGLIQINTRGLAGRVFRDPASSTGYILEDKHVAVPYLQLVKCFWPER